jgi:hypothetical protein
MKRIYHTWEKWECYPAGFYDNRPSDKTKTPDECQEIYRSLLSDLDRFEEALKRVLSEWPNSCEHYLSNENMNRIAWLGQSSLCISEGIPAIYRGGFNMLTEDQQLAANLMALKYLNVWLSSRGEETLTLEQAASKTQAELY